MNEPRASLVDWATSRLRRALTYAEARDLHLDDPELICRRRELVRRNRAARLSFSRWYRQMAAVAATAPAGERVELGSGGGFLDEFVPGLIKTELADLPFIDRRCSAEDLPFADASVGAILMVNVLHHVADVDSFFAEAVRTLVPGGVVVMTEPWVTAFSRFVYRHVHHEPFDPGAEGWSLAASGPLSGGNDALPWIVFARDRARFEAAYPELAVEEVRPHSSLVHLLSGGVTTRNLLPAFVFPALIAVEDRLQRLMPRLGLFCTVVLRRTGSSET